jgi:protein-S-isoprenylcysteine O-methyltransferase Ste14
VHFAALAILVLAVIAARRLPGFDAGSFLGLSTEIWAILAIADAVLHQVYVWLCWRAELHGGHLSRIFGAKAFELYAALFTVLFVARPILAFALGWSNRGTLDINPWLGYGVSLVLFGPVVYMMYSVRHYFTFRRAFGIDHFDADYRSQPLVRQGIFRWSPNAMYVFGFFMLWIPAFLFQSVTALIVAGFSHAYIWVHYFATEKPDMRRIYGP